MKKTFDSKFKARVALDALKGEKTIAQLSSEYEVHASQVSKWKQILQKGVSKVFSGKTGSQGNQNLDLIDKLYRNVGQLKVENDWLKKKLDL